MNVFNHSWRGKLTDQLFVVRHTDRTMVSMEMDRYYR